MEARKIVMYSSTTMLIPTKGPSRVPTRIPNDCKGQNGASHENQICAVYGPHLRHGGDRCHRNDKLRLGED